MLSQGLQNYKIHSTLRRLKVRRDTQKEQLSVKTIFCLKTFPEGELLKLSLIFSCK